MDINDLALASYFDETASPLDLRDFEDIDVDDAQDSMTAREVVFGLPASPGTVRR